MTPLFKKKPSTALQYTYSLISVIAVSIGCYEFIEFTGYHTIALLLLVTVSFIAMFFDILPVAMAAILSALIWNYFFIPPRYTFHIGKSEDILMFLMYFVIALLNAVLTSKIRQIEKKSQVKEEKENLLRLYNTLLNSLSHEFRTPISAIIGSTDNLISNKENLSEHHQNELLSEISTASLRLNRQVENLLNMSRLESGTLKINCDWCDINELVYGVLKQTVEGKDHQRISIQIPDSIPYFKIDIGLMEHVLINLVHNALNYTPENTKITIRAACHIEHLVIIVEDEGPGLPDDKLEKVFDRFFRLDHASPGGTGLGLSIVKGFVEAHMGKVSVQNRPEGGARFTIDIPAKTSYIKNLKNE